MCVCVCVCVCVRVYVPLCVCVSVWISLAFLLVNIRTYILAFNSVWKIRLQLIQNYCLYALYLSLNCLV